MWMSKFERARPVGGRGVRSRADAKRRETQLNSAPRNWAVTQELQGRAQEAGVSRYNLFLCVAVAAVLTALPASASADVLEIGPSGAAWVAGGPVVKTAEDVAVAAADAPVTQVPEAAGPAEWRGRVAELAAKYDISPSLLEALVWQESRWRHGAVSPVGARGLAQLMPGTARELRVNPDDANANLEGGARYLRMQLDAFDGDVEKALAAYNAGPGRVKRANGVPAIRETQNYVAAIMGRLSASVRR
jgi:soluble lytic murein transglycosylase-like protein